MLLRRRYMGGGEVPFEEQYLTFEALEAGTFTLTIPAAHGVNYLQSVSYSLDGGSTWTKTNNVDNTEVVITTPSVQAGDKVLWKGIGTSFATSVSNSSNFSSTGLFNAYGNIMSLCFGDSFIDKFNANPNMFQALFRYSKLVDASNLILQATTLSNSCYSSMFRDCSYLTTPPDLPARSLVASCYSYMFRYSSSVSYIKCLATELVNTNALNSWCDRVASNGIFVKDANATFWASGAGGIPSGWTVIEEP